MEIDLDVVMVIQDPPRLHSTNKEGKESESKESGVIDMTTEGESTPPSTPGRKGDKSRKKETPKKKTGPRLELSNKEKAILSKWPMTGYGPERFTEKVTRFTIMKRKSGATYLDGYGSFKRGSDSFWQCK